MAARASGDPWWKRPMVIDIAVVVLATVLVILVTVAS
jgi:hypothetical protein